MSVKDWARNYALKNSRNKSFSPKGYAGFTAVKSIGVLFEMDGNYTKIMDFADRLGKANKKVELMAYVPQKRNEITKQPQCSHFAKNETNWLGKPKGDVVRNFVQQSFDILLVLIPDSESPLQFVATASQAHFTVGWSNGGRFALDFEIKRKDENVATFFKELEHYLIFINR